MDIAGDIASQYARWSLYLSMAGPLMVCISCSWSAISTQASDTPGDEKYRGKKQNFIRLHRTHRAAGEIPRMDVFIDGSFVGYLRNGETRDFDVKPGNHSVYVRTEGSGRSKKVKIALDAEILQKNLMVETPASAPARLMFARRGELALREMATSS
jgi:hypothetical protein